MSPLPYNSLRTTLWAALGSPAPDTVVNNWGSAVLAYSLAALGRRVFLVLFAATSVIGTALFGPWTTTRGTYELIPAPRDLQIIHAALEQSCQVFSVILPAMQHNLLGGQSVLAGSRRNAIGRGLWNLDL